MFARETPVVWSSASWPKPLRRDHDLIAAREILERASQYFFAHAIGIHVGGIEEVDPEFEGTADERPAGVFVEHPRPPLRGAIRHRAKTDARDFQTRRTEADVIHSANSAFRPPTPISQCACSTPSHDGLQPLRGAETSDARRRAPHRTRIAATRGCGPRSRSRLFPQ